MTTLTFPTLSRSGPTAWTWRKLANTQTFESPLSRSVQTMPLPGARWACAATWDYLTREDAAALAAFLANLSGTAGRFYFGNLALRVPRGTASGTPLVAGAGQTGRTLATDGWDVGATLLAGDYIQFGAYELRMVVSDATADGTGAMAITLDEPMRASPDDNSAIVIANPRGIFRLSSDEQQWQNLPGNLTSFSLDAVESWT